ncbi:MAG: zinc ribbon domain-containing protein [Rhodanobacter sp.]
MPIYEYECPSCGHHFDHLQKLSDADPTVCPQCAAQPLHRMLSAPSFRLAGTGWYETDFKKPGDARHNLAGDAGAPKVGDKHDHAASADKTQTTKPGDGAKPAPPAAPAVASTPAKSAAPASGS